MTTIQHRRGTAAAWTASNRVLAAGEFGYETDTGEWKAGDGATAWVDLAYLPSAVDVATLFADKVDTADLDTLMATEIQTEGSETKAAIATEVAPRAAGLVANGDSLMRGGWVDLVGDYLGLSVYNPSVPGEGPPDIAVRNGGLAPQLTLAGDTIPATTSPVEVTSVTPLGGWRVSGDAGDTGTIGSFEGRLCGVPGTLTHDQVSGAWTFTRATAGSAVACHPGSRFRIGQRADRDAIYLFWAGRNYPAVTEVTRDTASMVAYVGGTPPKYVVLSVLNAPTEPLGNGGYDTIIAINDALAADYPDNYLDVRTYLIENGLAEAGITATAQDAADIANDVVPTSLRLAADNLHLNSTGAAIVARQVALFIANKGWVPTESVFMPAPSNSYSMRLPTFTSQGRREAGTDLRTAGTLSVRAIFTATDTLPAGPVDIVGRRSGIDGNAWSLFLFADGNLRFQAWNAAASTDLRDSAGGTPFVVGQVYGVRVDYDPSVSKCDFYTSADEGKTWTLFSSKTMSHVLTTTIPTSLRIGGAIKVDVHHVQVFNADASVIYLDDDFSGDNSDWAFVNGGSFISDWPYL